MARTRDDDRRRLDEVVADLATEFDTVHVFATRVSPKHGGTVHLDHGSGNWFGRYGHVIHWLKRHEAIDAADAAREASEDDDE